jgi:hypothetical protein
MKHVVCSPLIVLLKPSVFWMMLILLRLRLTFVILVPVLEMSTPVLLPLSAIVKDLSNVVRTLLGVRTKHAPQL